MAEDWFQDDIGESEDDFQITEYDITSSPNDFNISTLYSFIDSDVVKIPPFQRNYVWDLKRASRLIESLIMGLPVPQVFLYERARNEFLVIDGQQRLLSIYYFLKQRFPKPAKRSALRHKLLTTAATPDRYLLDDQYFSTFRLSLPHDPDTPPNPLHGLTYDTLDEYKTAFDLRTMRCVIVKQTAPKGSDSIYEIFNRLNSGGVNLMPQEIRMSLFHSPLLDMLNRINLETSWRDLLGRPDADLHLRDVEFLLRGVALLLKGAEYSPSMAKFLNRFARDAKSFDADYVAYIEQLIKAFVEACRGLTSRAFHGQTSKFTISIFDAVFAAACQQAFEHRNLEVEPLTMDKMDSVKNDTAFLGASQSRTTGTGNVKTRIERARALLGG